jgi:predicted DNA binding CopG/RHH family protein
VNKNLTKEENEIVEYIESATAQSITNAKDEMARYTKIAKEQTSKKIALSIRLPEADIYLLKQKALSSGISYQNIIQSLIHQYTHDKIKAAL